VGGTVVLDDIPRIKNASSTTSYTGKMLPLAATAMKWPTVNPISSISALEILGATAVARCKPTNATADLSVFLGELFSEGLPKLIGARSGLWQERTDAARKVAADEYLNLEFGWEPIARDMSSIAYAIYSADAVLRQYERDSGRMVRRRYNFPTEKNESYTEVGSGTPWILGGVSGNLLDPAFAAGGKVIRAESTTRNTWFSGAFTYHLPRSYSRSNEMARIALEAKKVLGLSLTPETAWNLTPWSWAVDWFSNVGDVLSNISDALTDSLVMGYGYLMEHTVQKRSYNFYGPTGCKTKGARPATVTFVIETKQRVQANPYGFGLTWKGLSPHQLSILSALGISRSGK